ncbi:SusE domain-containing protein [Ferruginibacter lapsinanis]|uniref:SusE domain-containing protein n=1 Tax=Ferruginibacter lapsinanis TaxID=563172 RepID=UPI001E32A8F6|nr:SusE domain-containing protein [Ferruginibacter lapsinanis]UEG50622.1 SusE domain-containing protein [Ferruginibacter lapsinanis]
MKHTFKLFAILVGLVATFASCDKADDLQSYAKGLKPALVSSVTTVAATSTQAEDTVLTFTWEDPKLGTSLAHQKFVIEMDPSTPATFANPIKSEAIFGKFSKAYKAKELNAMLLAWGFAFNTAHDISIRLVSSYGNNNDLSYSTPITVRMTPYKIPPKYTVPSKLFIVGGFADPYFWNNSSSNAPRSQFAQIDETTFGGVFQFASSQGYLLLPVNDGVWDNKYGGTGTTNGSNDPAGDTFKPQGSDLVSPATAGSYKVTFDFQFGTFTVVPSSIPEFDGLYITGSATASNWTNDPPSNQKFTRLNAVEYELTVALTPGNQYKFLVRPTATSAPDWHPQLGSTSSTGGALQYATPGDSPTMDSPAEAGNYKIHVNTYTGLYTITKV